MTDHDVVTLSPGEERRVTVGSGETLSNVLYDITADDCDLQIQASGTGWTIRDVGVRGKFSKGDSTYGDPSKTGGYNEALDVNGAGTIENVYLGDGLEFGVDKAIMIVGPGHLNGSGHIQVNGLHAAEFTNNGNYVAGYAGEQQGGQGGTMEFRDCYLRDNNVAHFRCSGNLTIRNTTIVNTNNVTPLYSTAGGLSNVINSRGIFANYSTAYDPVRVYDSDIKVTSANTCNTSYSVNSCAASAVRIAKHGRSGQIVLNDCEVEGSISGGVVQNNVGSNPDTSIPTNCPRTAEEAAMGLAGECEPGDCPPGEECVDGDCVCVDDSACPDGYECAGGECVVAGDELELIAPDSGEIEYEFVVDGEAWMHQTDPDIWASENNDSIYENADGTLTVEGRTGNGYGDAYIVEGYVLEYAEHSGLEHTIRLNGDVVTPDELVSEPDPPNQGPVADFDVATDGLEVQVDATPSHDPDGEIAAYDWDLGDGATRTGSLVSYTYAEGGDYTVVLTVTDADGAQDTASRSVSVESPAPDPCEGVTCGEGETCVDGECVEDPNYEPPREPVGAGTAGLAAAAAFAVGYVLSRRGDRRS